MFKKSEESEWTRLSRALGGTPPAPPREEEPPPAEAPEEAMTISQAPAVEPEVYVAPPPPQPAPEQPAPTYTPSAAPIAAPLSRLPDLERGETVIGDGASIDGTVRSERSIRVRGAVQGEIESQQRVVVEESAKVQARITAEHVTVLGEVNGSISCTGRLEIASTGRVTGEVSSGTLIIQEGAFFEGHLKMTNNHSAD